MTDQLQRSANGTFATGTVPNPLGRGAPARRAAMQAEAEEAERKMVEADLLADLGRAPSSTERVTVEVLSAQVVRARRMRAAGRHDAAEMAERLVLRGLGKLGVRQGPAKPAEDFATMMRRLATPAAAAGASVADPADVAADSGERTGAHGSQADGGS